MKLMKGLAFALLPPVVIVSALIAQTNPENPKFTLTIKAYKSEVTLGSDIGIAITVRSISDENFTYLFGNQGNVADGYEYDVRDEKGVPVAMYGKRTLHLPNGETLQYPRPPGRSFVGGMRPGDSYEQGSTISDIFQFDHPGKYTIQVSRKESWMPSPVYSNIITITVLLTDTKPTTGEPPPAQK
jgi:hypothetical protein